MAKNDSIEVVESVCFLVKEITPIVRETSTWDVLWVACVCLFFWTGNSRQAQIQARLSAHEPPAPSIVSIDCVPHFLHQLGLSH